jgi:hypothetical protein
MDVLGGEYSQMHIDALHRWALWTVKTVILHGDTTGVLGTDCAHAAAVRYVLRAQG